MEPPGEVRPPRASWVYRLAWIFYLVLALAGVFWLGWRQGEIPLGLFLDPGGWWVDLALGLSGGAILITLWRLARNKFSSAVKLERELAELLGQLTRVEIVALAILSGLAEELFFRGAVQSAWGWIPATILFAALHTGPGVAYRAWTAFAAVAGLMLAGLMLWRGNLLAPIVAHGLVNGVNLSLLVAQGEPPPAADPAQG